MPRTIVLIVLLLPFCLPGRVLAGGSEYVITHYGAKGDGKYDNAPILNALISRLPPQGGVIVIPDGEFVIDSPVVITSNFVTIRGENRGWRSNVDEGANGLAGVGGGSKLILGPRATAGIQVPLRPRMTNGQANRISGLAIRDLLIVGSSAEDGQVGVDIEQDGDGLIVDDVSCINLDKGLLIKEADASRISGCLIAECRNCIQMVGGIQNMVTDCHLGAQPSGVTCQFTNESRLMVTDNSIFPDGSTAIQLLDCQFCSIIGNAISVYYLGAIEIIGHDNALLNDTITAENRGRSWAKDPLGRDDRWGLVRISGDHNTFSGSTITSTQPSNTVAISCDSGNGNTISGITIDSADSFQKILINGPTAHNSRVLYSAMAGEIEINGTASETIVPIP